MKVRLPVRALLPPLVGWTLLFAIISWCRPTFLRAPIKHCGTSWGVDVGWKTDWGILNAPLQRQGMRYYVSMGRGTWCGNVEANIRDVLALASTHVHFARMQRQRRNGDASKTEPRRKFRRFSRLPPPARCAMPPTDTIHDEGKAPEIVTETLPRPGHRDGVGGVRSVFEIERTAQSGDNDAIVSNHAALCNSTLRERLPFCPPTTVPSEAQRRTEFPMCDFRTAVAAIDCAFVDGGTLGMEGALVYTRTHAYLGRRGFDGFNDFDNGAVLHGTESGDGKDGYGQHAKQFAERWQAVRARVSAARVNGSVLLRPHRLNELCETVNSIEKRSVVYDQQNVVHEELAHALIRLPCHFGHALLELMPRLELLRRALPPSVPVLMPLMPRSVQTVLEQRGLWPRNIVWWQPGRTYFARRVYFTTEVGHRHADGGAKPSESMALWDSIQCPWHMGLPYELLREAMLSTNNEATKHASRKATAPDSRTKILVVTRWRDAGSRHIVNIVELMNSLKRTFTAEHGFDVVEFVGRQSSFNESVASFNGATLVIGTHGTGLGWGMFLPPFGAILEIGYDDIDITLPRLSWWRVAAAFALVLGASIMTALLKSKRQARHCMPQRVVPSLQVPTTKVN